MSFNTALTSGQYESLRGSASTSASHRARINISLCPNTNVYTASVNQSVFASSFAQIGYDGGSGTLADVLVGMTVLISHTSSRDDAFFVGRVRKIPTSSVLYINETSAGVEDDDYIFVLDDFRIWDKLPRYFGGKEYPDYDVDFRELLPRIAGLKSAYADNTTSSVLSIDFAPDVYATTNGATISSYLWDVADGSIVTGTASTKNITAEFDPGFRWIHFTATDSNGLSLTRHIPVWAHDDTYPVTLLDHGDLETTISIDDGPYGSIPAFASISGVLDNTLICAWVGPEHYNESSGHIFDNIALVGRLRREDNQSSFADNQLDASTRFEIEGPLQQLARLEITSQEIDNDATPTAFNQVDTLTVWREIHLILTEYSTFHELHSVEFDDITDTYRERAIGTQPGSLLSVVNALANGINAKIQMNAAGEAEIVRDATMITVADRDALTTVGGWSAIDILDLGLGKSHARTVGRVDASGGTYNSTRKKVTPALSVAPGVAQDYPDGQQRLDNQVLEANLTLAEAETEISERSGHALAKVQERDELIITHPDGYWWLTPSLDQWYTFTLDGSETARAIVLDTSTRWQLVSITNTYEVETGTRTVSATYRIETSGVPGAAVRYPPQSTTKLTLPDFPPFPAFPSIDIGSFYLPDELDEDTAPATLAGSMFPNLLHDGNCVLVWTASQIFLANDFTKQLTPTWQEITPVLDTGEEIIQARFIPGSTPGALICTRVPSVSELSYDFAVSDGGWTTVENPSSAPQGVIGIYTSGVGWQSAQSQDPAHTNDEATHISLPISSFSQIDIYVNFATLGTSNANIVLYKVISGTPSLLMGWTPSLGSNHVTYATPVSGIDSIIVGVGVSGGASPQHNITITRVDIQSLGSRVWYKPNIGSTSAWSAGQLVSAQVALMRIGETFADVYLWDAQNGDAYYSDDYGVTFSSAITVGTPPSSDAGFDTGRLGTVTLAGADTLVRIATTQGGSYSDYTTVPTDTVPTAIFIPRYKFSGSNNGAGISAPDYLLGSVDPASGTGYGLFKVTAGGATTSNVTPVDGSSNKGLSPGPNCLNIPWYSAAYQDILAVLDFNGSRKLAVSTDSGSTWVISGAINAAAEFLTTRRSDAYRRQLFIANGVNLIYCSSYRTNPATLATRIGPTANTVLGIDVLP